MEFEPELGEKMEDNEPKFKFPDNWVHEPETKCYTNLDTRDTFCYSEEQFCFIDTVPNQTLLQDCHTKLETGNNIFAKEEPLDFVDNAIAAMETVPEQCHSNLEIGNAFCAKEEPFNSVDNAIAAMEIVPNQAPRRVTEEELNKKCSRCQERGHDCLSCDIPITNRLAQSPVPTARKIVHCGLCGEAGHTRRSCFRAV